MVFLSLVIVAGMGGYLRSAPMEYVSLLLTEPVAHDVLTRLGNLAIPAIQFTDVSSRHLYGLSGRRLNVYAVMLPRHCLSLHSLQMNGDLTAFKRHYTPFIRRCDDLEKKLAFFEAEMTKHGIEPEEYTSAE
jgi:V-type H+-transporting ATPase subunit a